MTSSVEDYTLEAVENHTGVVLSGTKPSEDFTNSRPTVCPAVYSIVTSGGGPYGPSDIDAGTAMWLSIDDDGYIAIDEVNYPGGADMDF